MTDSFSTVCYAAGASTEVILSRGRPSPAAARRCPPPPAASRRRSLPAGRLSGGSGNRGEGGVREEEPGATVTLNCHTKLSH